MGKQVGVGIIGLGAISAQYLESLSRLVNLKLVAVADNKIERAQEIAAQNHCDALEVKSLIEDPRINIILNLTTPQSHAKIIERAITCGKDVFTEKPLALSTSDIAPIMKLAASRGINIGCAPDTVLGTGIQTSKDILDKGIIGEIVGASAFWSAPGPETWHPAPDFLYQTGAGPLFDMGPYYLTTLVTLLGPVVKVVGSATRSNRVRRVGTGPLEGREVPIQVETHVNAILYHENGLASSITVSFEIWGTTAPLLEIFGTQGTLSVPDPNQFSAIPKIRLMSDANWSEVPASAGYVNAGRGYGLAEMAASKLSGREPRLSGELGYHILDIMESILVSAQLQEFQKINSTVKLMSVVELSEIVV